jgi:hypothetical protein
MLRAEARTETLSKHVSGAPIRTVGAIQEVRGRFGIVLSGNAGCPGSFGALPSMTIDRALIRGGALDFRAAKRYAEEPAPCPAKQFCPLKTNDT